MNPAKVESAMTLPSYFGNCGLHTLIHICSFEILLPHIVVILPELDINIAAIDVKSWMSPKTYHTHIISKLL
jgi:hypothetical protein